MRLVNHHFDQNKINIAFFLGGLLLLGTWVWAIYDDYEKPYKEYQRTYYDVYARQLRYERQENWSQSKEKELRQKQQELSQLQSKLEARGGELDKLRKQLQRLNKIKYQKADDRVKTINSEFTPVEYKYQKAVVRAEEEDDYEVPDTLKRKYKKLKRQYEEAVEARERLRENREGLENTIEEKRSRISSIESDIRELTQQKAVIESTLNRVENNLLNRFLDAPMVNFVRPRVEVKQFQVSGMFLDYNFERVNRRDYCKSCHMGIDNPAFQLNDDGEFKQDTTRNAFQDIFPNEKERARYKEVFKTHPRYDLIGPSNAKYPFSEVGCTGCHMGDGRALDFTRAAHKPDNKEEKKEWKKLYDWKPRHYWEEKMLKDDYYEAGFRQFYPYGSKVNIPDAEKLNEGRELWRQAGCSNCHAVEGMNYQRKVGFSLKNVSSKLDRNWVKRWVEKPTDFDPTTRMPQVFHKSNTNSPYERELNTVVIESITTYLFEESGSLDLDDPPSVPGNPEDGERLVKETGCMGCHSMVEEGFESAGQAPDLSNVGEKVNRRWLYNWLRNPRAIWENTHMPSMKLSREEANDITAYLMDQTAEDWDADNYPTQLKGDTPVETLVDQRLEDIASRFLGRTRGPQATEDELENIKSSRENGQKALKHFVGEQAVEHFGCASCHAIPGFEEKLRIGPELTGWANKSTHKLGYNYIHIPHTRQDFVENKLKHPGIFDRGMEKSYLGKLRMPKPRLTEEELKKVATHVMSLKAKNRISPDQQFLPSSSDKIAYEGRKLVNEYNCQGCHTLDEESPITDYLRKYYQKKKDRGEPVQLGDNDNPAVRSLVQAHVPPTLTNTGNKLSQDWLFKFLKNPKGPNGRDRIRTWQHVRMPNFQFTDEEASTITQGLGHEGWEKSPPIVSDETRDIPPESRRVGRVLFEQICANCHIAEGDETFHTPQMTPNLNYIGQKFHYKGFLDWIEAPGERFVPEGVNMYRHQGMIPYTKLPVNESLLGFEPNGDYSTKESQMKALRDYIFYQQNNL